MVAFLPPSGLTRINKHSNIRRKEVTLYSNNCPNCKVVKKVLTSKDISFREINDMNEIMEAAKREQLAVMPLLDIDGVFYSGAEAIKKVKEL